MKPLRLSLRNCRTFQEIDLDIPEGLVAILGSNGAGKSTLINAIDVALFGSRSLGSWYPRDGGEEPLQIELVFEHDREHYRVRRSYSPKGRGQTKVDLEQADLVDIDVWKWEALTRESIAETDAEIERLIGITRETFRASSFLAQNEAGLFCEAAPRQRKAILADVIGLGQWDTWLERARTERRSAESELDQIAGALGRAEEELAERPNIEAERTEIKRQRAESATALQATLAALSLARVAHGEAEKQAERRANAERDVALTGSAVSDAKNALNQREAEIKMIDVRLADRDSLKKLADRLPTLAEEAEALRVEAQRWTERERLEHDLARLVAESEKTRTEISTLERKADAALAGNDEVCDRCGQSLHAEAAKRAAMSFQTDAEAARRRMADSDAEAVMVSVALTDLPIIGPSQEAIAEGRRLLLEAQGAAARLAALDEAAARREQAQREVDEMRAGLPEREAAEATARAALEALGPHDLHAVAIAAANVKSRELSESGERAMIAEFDRAIAAADSALARLDKIAADVGASGVRRDELHAEIDLLANLEKACGPNGVPALILETVAIPQVETEATRILGLLGGPAYAVELRTLREKKTGGLSDTLDIVLLTETGEAPYESFSGGERARIAFALRLALAQLLASRKGSPTGLLVIDELEGLDAQGIAALVSVLEDLQRSVPTIIVVSHVAEMRDAFENTILLEQVDGKSRVVNELMEVA